MASFQSPFCATLMPKSTCDFALERASASAGCATPSRTAAARRARARRKARKTMGDLSTIVTRFNHRKLFPWTRTRVRGVYEEQWTYHGVCHEESTTIARKVGLF